MIEYVRYPSCLLISSRKETHNSKGSTLASYKDMLSYLEVEVIIPQTLNLGCIEKYGHCQYRVVWTYELCNNFIVVLTFLQSYQESMHLFKTFACILFLIVHYTQLANYLHQASTYTLGVSWIKWLSRLRSVPSGECWASPTKDDVDIVTPRLYSCLQLCPYIGYELLQIGSMRFC